jgi:hypothetical protein
MAGKHPPFACGNTGIAVGGTPDWSKFIKNSSPEGRIARESVEFMAWLCDNHSRRESK